MKSKLKQYIKAMYAACRNFISKIARFTPARLTLLAFAGTIFVITCLLLLPFSTSHGQSPPFVDALFTATSAVCVTGLSVVPTASYWSASGQFFIMMGIKIGGLGVMTLASLLGLAVSKRLGLTQRMLAASERGGRLGDVGSLLRAVIFISFIGEGLVGSVLFTRFLAAGEDLGDSIWHAAFMAVSTFNNAGFDNLPEGLGVYAGDWWFCSPIIIGTAMGSLGFPVILDLARNKLNYWKWSLHTKLSLTMYLTLFVCGALAFCIFEWNNANTIGELGWSGKTITGLFHSAMARSTGLSTVNVGQWNEATWFATDVLMFIGGGSAGTAGGIKISTFAVLLLAIMAEARGDRDIEVFWRRIPPATVRLAIGVAILGAATVGLGTLALLTLSNLPLDVILFEAISAFGTCGLSAGITSTLPEAAQYVLIVIMFAGRTGTMTLAAALAMRERRRVIRMAEERPLVG